MKKTKTTNSEKAKAKISEKTKRNILHYKLIGHRSCNYIAEKLNLPVEVVRSIK